jgi:P4 family phage/plasmid primase-like protien
VTGEDTGTLAGPSRHDPATLAEHNHALMLHALAYLDLGWKLFVIPASDDGTAKTPAPNCDTCRSYPGYHDREACTCLLCHGFYAATDDAQRITAMLDRCPGGSLALRTGRESGVSVIDAESHADVPGTPTGVDVIDAWEDYAPNAELTPTAMARSASGGLHLFYTTGDTLIPSLARVLPGVDLKSNNGYVVLPPGARGERVWLTPDSDGVGMRAADGYGPPPLAPASESLTTWLRVERSTRAARARTPGGAGGPAIGYDFDAFLRDAPPPGFQDTFLNDWFFRSVRHHGETSEDELFAMAWAHVQGWTQNPRRPWTESDVRRKARYVLESVDAAPPLPDWIPRRAYADTVYRAVLGDDGVITESVSDTAGVLRELAPGEAGDHGFRALERPGAPEGAANGTAPWDGAPDTRAEAARVIREAESVLRARRPRDPVEASGNAPAERPEDGTPAVVPGPVADIVSALEGAPVEAEPVSLEFGTAPLPEPDPVEEPVAPVIPIRPQTPRPDGEESQDDGADPVDSIVPAEAVRIGGGGYRGVGYHGADGTCDGQPGTEGMNDTGNANRFVRLFGRRVRWLESEGVWLVWDGTRWQRDRTNTVRGWTVYVATDIDRDREAMIAEGRDKEAKALAKWMVVSGESARREGMLRCVRAVPGITVTPEMLDTNPMQLVVANGVVDLKTGRLEKGSPEDLNTLSGDVKYKAGALCPLWEAHVERVTCGDRELAEHLQRVAGYTLTGDTGAQAFFSLEGTGANGKNVFIETLMAIMGDYATTASTKLVTQGDRGHMAIVADLMGKRMVFVDEIPQGRHLDVERVKTLVGSARIKAQFMARNWFEFTPQMKLWIAGNDQPSVRDASDGIWRRMRRILFKAVIPENERILNFQRILMEQEGPGILNWALKGLADYQARGERLDAPESVTKSVEEMKDDEDVPGQFMDECCEFTGSTRVSNLWDGVTTEGDWVHTSQIMSVYTAWCDGMGVKPHDRLTAIQLVRRMVSRGAVKFNDRRSGDRRARGLEGVKLTTTAMGLWSRVLGRG